MADSVRTLMSVQHPTSALLPPPVSIPRGHFTVTVAAASSLITPSAMTWMNAWQAAAAPTQSAQIHLAPSPVSVQQDIEEMVLPAWMWMSAPSSRSVTLMPFVSISLAPTTAPAKWDILEMGQSNAMI